MSYTYSPLRYPGGKSKLFNYTKDLIITNNLVGCTYVEPFAGGAGLALALLYNKIVDNIILNDIDRSIYAFWYSVLNYNEEFCKLIENSPISLDEWNKQKNIQEDKRNTDLLTLGFSTFYLNRTNRSGIIKGGIIGGKKQLGNYKMDCRFNKANLISRIKRISLYRDKISIYNLDASIFIDNVITLLNNNSLVFIDPPYYKKGPELYENHFKHDDHLKLSTKIVNTIAHPWVITYDNTDEIKTMYKNFTQAEFNLNYSAQNKYQGKEVMVYSEILTPIPFKKASEE
ncbi:MAG: adenine methylase [Clostridia bacterium]|nr:adenine methylase [Clostridia bacterium]